MTEEKTVEVPKIDEKIDENKKHNKIICLGLDVGTMHLVCSKSDSDDVGITRNVFLKVDKDDISISQLSSISYVEGIDGELFIIGSDAFEFANIFGTSVLRPMESGLISPKEIAAIDVLTLMIKSLIGETKDKEVYCSFSIPAESVDSERSVTYHKNVFSRILSNIGVNHTPVNEAMAIIYSECAKENFSGIAISFGAGMCNCCISYKGVEALTFSTSRSGDWIDKMVAADLDMVPNRVTNLKEKYMKLTGNVDVKNKKTKRVLEALYYYHKALIEYTVKRIIKEFDERVDIEIDDKIPIVIAGGTCLPEGFISLFRNIISASELPFEVSEIRRAKNPLTAVANGLLVRTMADAKSMGK
ncbi:MAG TPA: hypothetical protein VMX17_08605 [Candidatus Glassbacteria bacterium]|nr:hypothetical protein [Candidatus Glassbacteria bacterium]